MTVLNSPSDISRVSNPKAATRSRASGVAEAPFEASKPDHLHASAGLGTLCSRVVQWHGDIGGPAGTRFGTMADSFARR